MVSMESFTVISSGRYDCTWTCNMSIDSCYGAGTYCDHYDDSYSSSNEVEEKSTAVIKQKHDHHHATAKIGVPQKSQAGFKPFISFRLC